MSIFEDELKIVPMNAKRRYQMKAELAGILIMTLLLTFGCWWLFEKQAIGNAISEFLGPFFEPMRPWATEFVAHQLRPFLETYISVPFNNFLSNFSWCRNLGRDIAYTIAGLSAAFREVAMTFLPFTPALILIAYHNGFWGIPLRKNGERTVLGEEFHKWKILHFGPKIVVPVEKKRTVLQETSFILGFLLVAWVVLFLLCTGCLANVMPGYAWRQISDGTMQWLVACLRDAHFQVPSEWMAYMKHETFLCRPLINMNTEGFQYFYTAFLDPFHKLIPPQEPMPADLWNFRIFASAAASLAATVPFALMLSSWGLDCIASTAFVIRPAVLVLRRRFIFSIESKFKWEDLISLDGVPAKEGEFYLNFRGGRKLRINIRDFKESQQKLMFQAIDELAAGCVVSDEIRKNYFPSAKDASVGYTLFWEDALASRRRSTVFVPLKDGETLADGKIVVQRQLAGQGWAATYLARMQDKPVVLRESHLSQESEQSRKAAEMLQRESKILLSLKHKSIAEVLDCFVENGRSYLLLEYVPGRDLRQHIGLAGALPQSTVIKMALQICSILQYLHEQDPPVIHRDLSPDNLVVTENGEIRLIDFGASKQSIENATGTLIGKQAFMAPEQLRGKASVKSDIYALGATLHWLLTAKEPMALSQSHPQSLVSDVSAALDSLVAEMTSFEAEDRPASVAEIKSRLEQIPLEEEAGAVISLAKKMTEICRVASTSFKQLKEEAEHE